MEPAKLGKEIEKITAKYRDGIGISIMADEDTFKSTYQILFELSKVWDKLKDTEKSYLLERIAGKHRATQIAAILTNGETLADAYIAAMESTGSAQDEFEKRTQSIEYHLSQLSAAWQELSLSAASVEFINNAIDSLRGLLEVLNEIGVKNASFAAFGTTLGILAQFKGIPALEAIGLDAKNKSKGITLFKKELVSLSDYGPKVAGAMKLVEVSIKGITSAIGGMIALYAIKEVLDFVTEAIDKYVNRIQYMQEDIDEISSIITDLNNEMSTLQAK